jgi:hypothetical protein
MRTIVTIVGVLAILLGLVWVGQGTGYLTYTPPHMHPSFMIGDMHWTYYGAGLAVVGLVLVFLSRRDA